MKTTRSLFKKLRANGKMISFHQEILKSIKDKHMHFLTEEEAAEALSGPHCFSFLNYTEKLSRTFQKIRPVSNSSSSHVSGSVNSWLPVGPNLINSLKGVFESWRLKRFAILSDLRRCYRCMRTSHQSNLARLHLYPKNINDPACVDLLILMLTRSTDGNSQEVQDCPRQSHTCQLQVRR